MRRSAWLIDLGRRDYAEVWALQKALVAERIRGSVPDALLLVEHPPVITLGRHHQPNAFQTPASELGIPVYEIERGGQSTYHGPGQLVGYPILKLEGDRRDLHRYLRDLEAVLIEALGAFGIPAQRSEGATGVWTQSTPPRKLASIGIAVRRWVTYHGFALNVSTDLRDFQRIAPCGFTPDVMSSMELERGRSIGLAEVADRLHPAFEARFGRTLVPRDVGSIKVPAVQPPPVNRN